MDALVWVLALGTGVVVLATAVITLVLAVKNRKQVKEVHVLVNSNLARTEQRVNQLADALEASGVEVPPPEGET